ncbi:MAG: type II toxin-antitoxin system Phd/YefM family antitoxin [Myxococcota bacterium]
MPKVVSIAQAKDQFSQLVHDAEDGGSVHITRRGRPVAVLLSAAEYTRLANPRLDFWVELDAFRREHRLSELGLDADEWDDVRRSQPRMTRCS